MELRKLERLLEQFLKGAPTHEALDLRDALIPVVEEHDFLVNASASDGTAMLLALDRDSLTFYRRHGEAIDSVTHGIRGAILIEHQKLVEGGLLRTGFTLKHPVLPLTGEVKIDARDVPGNDEASFRHHLAPFLAEGPST